jgi:hypothetical protein
MESRYGRDALLALADDEASENGSEELVRDAEAAPLGAGGSAPLTGRGDLLAAVAGVMGGETEVEQRTPARLNRDRLNDPRGWQVFCGSGHLLSLQEL